MMIDIAVKRGRGDLQVCDDSSDPRGHAPVGVFWECQNGAQRQLFTLWQVHADLHGGVSCCDIRKCTFKAVLNQHFTGINV